MSQPKPRLQVLVASWLDAPLVARIAAADPDRIEVLYEPDLLPPARFQGDHSGPPRNLSEAQLERWRSLLSRAEAMFDFDWEAPGELLRRAPHLRYVQATSSGIGPLVKRLKLAGSPVRITNAAGIHAQPLAEFVLMAALHFTKEMPKLTRWKDEKRWERYCALEIAGSRMLVIGLGKVGERTAELCSAAGIEIVGLRRSEDRELPKGVSRMITLEELDAELPETDFLVLAAPATAQTRNLVDRRLLGLLPERAVLINVGRGSLIDEPALVEALQEGRLRGAGLDVFAEEPLPATSALWGLPNVIIAPHSVSTVPLENDRLVDLFIDNLQRHLDGRPLINEFDHARGY